MSIRNDIWKAIYNAQFEDFNKLLDDFETEVIEEAIANGVVKEVL